MAAPNSRDKLVEEFLRFLEVERNVSARTLTVYRQALAAFRGQKDARSWLKCSADDFRDYLFELMKSGQARSYIRLQFSAFRTFYRFLVERKNLRLDPVRQLQLPKAEKKLPLTHSACAGRCSPPCARSNDAEPQAMKSVNSCCSSRIFR